MEARETIFQLTSNYDSMMEQFAQYVQSTAAQIENIQAKAAQASEVADVEGDAAKADGDRLLGVFAAMRENVLQVTTETVVVSSGKKQVAKKTRGRKKVKDSGIGMENDEDEAMLAA
jgi:myosin protein heavy chain